MRILSLPQKRNRVPDAESERRSTVIRREAGHRQAPFLVPSPVLKQPQWKNEVPMYLLVGGAAGAASAIACAADSFTDDLALVNHARWMAAGGGALSGALLTKDLGVPSRLIHMLRAFKKQSPKRVGAWTLAIFSTFAGAAAFANQMRQELDGLPIRVVEIVSGTIAGITGLAMATYSGVLMGGTPTPAWDRDTSIQPGQVAASSMNSAVSILELLGHGESRALNLLGVASSALESLEGMLLETKRQAGNQPLRQGANGALARMGGVLSGPLPLLLRITSMFSTRRDLRRAAAYSSLAGSLLTRFTSLQAAK